MPRRLRSTNKLVGAKQTLKALESNDVETIYVAKNANACVIDPVISLSQSKNVPIVYFDTMVELGQACKIDVGAAVASIIK